MIKLIEKWIKNIDTMFFSINKKDRDRKIELVSDIVEMIQNVRFNGIKFDAPIELTNFRVHYMTVVDAPAIIIMLLEYPERRPRTSTVPIFELSTDDIETIHNTLKKCKPFG